MSDDRLAEIKARLEAQVKSRRAGTLPLADTDWLRDIAWLVAEVERLRATEQYVAYLADQAPLAAYMAGVVDSTGERAPQHGIAESEDYRESARIAGCVLGDGPALEDELSMLRAYVGRYMTWRGHRVVNEDEGVVDWSKWTAPCKERTDG